MEFTPDIGGEPSTEILRPKARGIRKPDTSSDDFLDYVDDPLVTSTSPEARVDALMLAHVPPLQHPAPVNELTVGFGTRGTRHPITTHGVGAYGVEIEAEVPRAAHPLFNLIINDARDHLKIAQRKYDVIATDVPKVQCKQNSSLYTVKYFQLMDDCLSSNGVACAY